ncbi:CBS domain-containing protein [Limisalsivibrio acetivorans]|uniref:CBS domain-containing protein n=1 Tax=Limisalsivibrio acetivorans TaxID=1304888 RepID=UPI0003B359A0|nr:CBS domain-containing protein [Limisalsivibrio acetivorans]
MKIKEIMTTGVVTAKPEETIKQVILRIRSKNISGLPIVNSNGKVIGVFSETDVMKALPDILNDAEAIPMIDVKEISDHHVRMLMSEPLYTLTPEDEVKEAATIMLEKYVHRVPIIENGKLVGIVSLGDILKAYTGN